MNNLFAHRSHHRPRKGLTTVNHAIIDEKEQTPMCGPWHWMIPKLHIPPAVRSLYFILRRRTSVTLLKPSDVGSDVIYGKTSSSRISNMVRPLTQTAFSRSSSRCLQQSISNSVGAVRDVSTSCRCPVAEDEVFTTARSDTLKTLTKDHGNKETSEEAESKKVLSEPDCDCKSNMDYLINQQVGKGLNNDESALDPVITKANFKEIKIGHELAQTKDGSNDGDINTVNGDINTFNGESADTSLKTEVGHPVDILAITHSPLSSASSDTDSDIEINIHENEVEFNTDEVPEPRSFSRLGRECWGEQEPMIALAEGPKDLRVQINEDCNSSIAATTSLSEERVSFGSSADLIDKHVEKDDFPWIKSEETTVENDSELEEELDFYEDNDKDGDDYLDMDNILQKCPPTEVLQNLRDMVQLSKNMTSQLERSLRRAARISCGPFPRLPGTGLTKTEVINLKCEKLVGETEDFLGDINKNFLTFYTVLEQMDKVGAQQDSFVSSILMTRGPRDWRRGHAAILRKMDKLWSKHYTNVITRKLKGSIKETIYEVDEEKQDFYDVMVSVTTVKK